MNKKFSDNGTWGCLVIVDVQKAFPAPTGLVDHIRRYSRRFQRRIFTRFENPPGSLFRKVLNQHSCAPGSPETALVIEPSPGDLVLVKRGYGLERKDIRRLKQMGVKRVTVCGIDTDACVMGVMFSLFDAGIESRVKKDLCWSSSGLHAAGMKIIETQFPPPREKSAPRRSRVPRRSSHRKKRAVRPGVRGAAQRSRSKP
jgi:nicotinamidase-related amidase